MAIHRFGATMSLVCLPLAACTSYQGADRIHIESAVGSAPRALGLKSFFTEDLKNAMTERSRLSPSIDRSAVSAKMLNSGFALIRANCSEYFNEMGRNQRNSRVLRDLLTPVTNIINGLVSLQFLSTGEKTNNDILAGFALVSGAAGSTLDIYDNRFLFGADNIGSVRSMTMTALSNHQLSVTDNPPTDIVFAITHLMDNEDICTPTQILTLVRESIKGADPNTPDQKPDGDGGDDDNDAGNPLEVDDTSTEEDDGNAHRSVSVTPG